MSRRPVVRLAVAFGCAALFAAGSAPAATAAPLNCPAPFPMLHDDVVGELELPAGAYLIKVSDPAKVSCAQAVANLTEFLSDYDGLLRRPWVTSPANRVFSRGFDSNTAFSLRRIGPAPSTVPPPPNPTLNACPGYFKVSHDDHIGMLAVPAARYRITLTAPRALGCATAARELARFLRDIDGRPSRPWRIGIRNATFRIGRTAKAFRIKPAVGAQPDPRSQVDFPGGVERRACRGDFQMRASDSIGALRLNAGAYLTFPSRRGRLSCRAVARLFGRFLEARGNRLPKRWRVDAGNGTFRRGKRVMFRVKPSLPTSTTRRP